MIGKTSITSFSDELVKISGVLGTAKKWISSGWHYPMGHFEKVPGKVGEEAFKARPQATWMGQGNITSKLPIGDKSLTLGFAAMGLPSALKQEDPSGEGRSRGERLSALAGGTVGGLAGMGAMAHLPIKGFGVTRALIGGLGGSMIGERAATLPFRAMRRAEVPSQSPEQMMLNGGAQ